jgi:hypothetical protein
MSKRLTLAAQVNASDCLFVSDGSGGFGLKRVTSTRSLTDTGIYTAITKNPYLVSCPWRLSCGIELMYFVRYPFMLHCTGSGAGCEWRRGVALCCAPRPARHLLYIRARVIPCMAERRGVAVAAGNVHTMNNPGSLTFVRCESGPDFCVPGWSCFRPSWAVLRRSSTRSSQLPVAAAFCRSSEIVHDTPT